MNRTHVRMTTMIKRVMLTLVAVLVGAPVAAQTTGQPPQTNQDMLRELDLGAPNAIRTGGGEPGPGYWQNRADYTIHATLDTVGHRLSGSETIHYVNNSPAALEYVWIQLDQNLFRPGSRGALVNAGNRWRGSFEGGGYTLSRVDVTIGGTRVAAARTEAGTRMRIDLPEPLPASGGEMQLDIEWSFLVPEYGADRMGRFHGADGWVYEIAQWYPRMSVFDAVNGWNPLPYIGQGEFYLEYGDFDVSLTVPRSVTVLGAGVLANEAEVLTAEQRQRLAQARQSAETVRIITPGEVGTRSARLDGDGSLTWHFTAENVRDFAWAASRAFIWDATSWNDVLVMAAYPREGLGTDEESGWERAAEYGRHSIAHYSDTWYRYPYPVAINIAGVVGGMEYPMIVFCGVSARDFGLFGVTDHELGHSWFPMIVGSDERRWAWMDEGFNTFINHYSTLAFYGSSALPRLRTVPSHIVEQSKLAIADQPIMTHPDYIRSAGLGFLAYRKPGYGLVLLRDLILGPERFDAAFQEYIRRWAYKHPQPADFFRTIEDVSGEDLAWFWRGWFYSTEVLDQAIVSVAVSGTESVITLENRAGLIMPAVLGVTFADGEKQRIDLPVEIWATSDLYTLPMTGRVTHVTLDPDQELPDIDRGNNEWTGGS
jgi:hypothetical protein